MEQGYPIIIHYSKWKLLLHVLGGSIFVAAGLLLLTLEDGFAAFAGMVSIAFFGTLTAFMFVKLFDNKPGLVLDEKGITDRSTIPDTGLVPWDEITGFVYRSYGTFAISRFFLVTLKNPKDFVRKNYKGFRSWIMSANVGF